MRSNVCEAQWRTRKDTRVYEIFSGKNQIRKIQRRVCRGGEEEFVGTSENHALSTGCVVKTKAGVTATAKLPAQVRASGAGASDTTQHSLLPAKPLAPGLSAWCIPIRSQSVFVCGVRQSPNCECAIAQAETGSNPSPASPSATMKLRALRIIV